MPGASCDAVAPCATTVSLLVNRCIFFGRRQQHSPYHTEGAFTCQR